MCYWTLLCDQGYRLQNNQLQPRFKKKKNPQTTLSYLMQVLKNRIYEDREWNESWWGKEV